MHFIKYRIMKVELDIKIGNVLVVIWHVTRVMVLSLMNAHLVNIYWELIQHFYILMIEDVIQV